MEIQNLEYRILASAAQQGWAVRFAPVERRLDLWSELENRLHAGEFDEPFAEERIRGFEKPIRKAPTWARSILLAAIPDPARRIRFGWEGQEVHLTIPPTFIHAASAGEPRLAQLVRSLPGVAVVRTEPAILPKKLLAARTGLSKYGRNNITYIEGLGSYYRLSALYTDVACDSDSWQVPEVVSSCEHCGACTRACPVGAIVPERFLVRGERCLTFWQEKPADIPYPDGFDFSFQNQFIGCMQCQIVCPQNRGRLHVKENGPPFTEAETVSFLQGVAEKSLATETLAKLKQHDILEYLPLLRRNLLASLRNAASLPSG